MKHIYKRSSTVRRILITIFLILLFIFLFFGRELSSVSHLVIDNIFRGKTTIIEYVNIQGQVITKSKNDLVRDNISLENQNRRLKERISIINKRDIKEELEGRKEVRVIRRPPSIDRYAFIVDSGEERDINIGDLVFTSAGLIVGEIDMVFKNSARVLPFTNDNIEKEFIVGDLIIKGDGRGGDVLLRVPKDNTIEIGELIEVIDGDRSYPFGTVSLIETDTADIFKDVFVMPSVNIFEILDLYIE